MYICDPDFRVTLVGNDDNDSWLAWLHGATSYRYIEIGSWKLRFTGIATGAIWAVQCPGWPIVEFATGEEALHHVYDNV